MAVTYPLASPVSYGWSTLEWGPFDNTARGRTAFTLQDIVQVYDGACWKGKLTIIPQAKADGRALAAWISSLKGRRGTFLLGDPACAAPLGSARTVPGAPVVDGAGQSGGSLAVRGLPAGASGYLLAGDYLQLGSGASARLHMVLNDVDADGAGEAAIDLRPNLRSSPGDGDAVTIDNPQGVFALARPYNPWQVRIPLIYDGVVLDVEEVVP